MFCGAPFISPLSGWSACAWSARKFRGDSTILPVLHLLTGIGLILAVSLRDPLRDTLEFRKFAWGVALGCAMLLLPLLRVFHYQRFSRWTYTPLLAALALFMLLMVRGSGPTGSDAQSESRPVSACGADQDFDRLFPRRIFRAQVGMAARPADAPLPMAESAAALAGAAGDAGHRDSAGHVFPAEGPRAGTHHRISFPADVRDRPQIAPAWLCWASRS